MKLKTMVRSYNEPKSNYMILLSMPIKLSQGCSSTNIKQANTAVFAASNQQLPIISVRSTVCYIFETRKCFDWFRRVSTVNVNLKQKIFK